MQKIMFNERYGLQSAVLEGRKTQTRREMFYSAESVCCEFNHQGRLECFTYDDEREYIIHTSRYAEGEIVAIAQSYLSIFNEADDGDYWADIYADYRNANVSDTKGWNNKMFVRADLMPHHIKITDIRCERLQEISDDDCLKEGIIEDLEGVQYSFSAPLFCGNFPFDNPRGAFSALLNKLNGKEFWDTNPYVIVYEFELVD